MDIASTSTPPGPRGIPVLGNALSIARDALVFLRACGAEYGDLVRLQFLRKPILFVNHPDYITDVLVTNHRNLVKGVTRRSDHLLLGDGISLSEGDAWRRERRLLQPAFHREFLAHYSKVVIALAERLLAEWRDGETRDVSVEMSKLTLAIVGKALLDIDVWDEDADLAGALVSLVACRDAHARSLSMLLPDRLPTPMNLRIGHARRRIDVILQRLIDRRRTAGDEGDDLLSALLRARDQDGKLMTDQQVRNEVVTILIGGHETVADLLSWAWYLLSQHPVVEAKLLAELDAVLGDRLPTVLDLPRLPYTGMVVSEVLRLYPPASVLSREAIADFEIRAYHVARGTEIVMSPWVLQRDPRYFTVPDAFDPDRWADGLASRLPRYAYFPFGGGPRLCLGRSFATLEAILVLGVIARRFQLNLVAGHPVIADPIPTLHPKFGLRMIVQARQGPPRKGYASARTRANARR